MGSKTGAKVERSMEEAARRMRADERMKGKAALAWIVKEHPENLVAWLWLARCLTGSEEKVRRLPRTDPAGSTRRSH
jgi:hypothetical protein